jgi:hypothetical protein
MVSWAGDGLVAGYDPITNRLKAGLYHFATPGSVDLRGITRIEFPMGAGLSAATYPNRLEVTAPFTFVAGDFTANPGKSLSAALYLCDAARFPAGHVPTPSEILALGDAYVNVYRATYAATSPQTHTFSMPGWSSGLSVNKKYWVLVLPTALADVNSSWNLVHDKPMAGITVNTFGRALSLLANQTPLAPTITSPANGSVAVPGSIINLAFTPNDPDAVIIPDDSRRFNRDLAGVQVQYAHTATAENPTPVWRDLPFDVDVPGLGVSRWSAWQIRGSRYWNGLAGLPEFEAMISNLGFPIIAGAGDSPSDYAPGHGALPSGDWQIRVRTFDYGHPYPGDGISTTAPGPLGINPATTQLKEPAKDNYPAGNTSPWSEPVLVSIPTQVPPPIPLSPTDSIAVLEGEDVQLTWLYRNTHLPPRTQYRRAVQIRPVSGNNDWATVFDGYSPDAFVDLPPSLTQTSVPPLEMLADGGFEGGGLDGWSSPNVGATVTNITSAPNAHSGSHYLQLTGITEETVLAKNVVPTSEYERAEFSIWVYNDPTYAPTGLIIQYWLDASDGVIIPDDPFNSPFSTVVSWDTLGSGWNHLVVANSIHRPPGGVTLRTEIYADKTTGSSPYTFRFDDASIMVYGPDLDDFSMEATTEYEWRVKVTDTDAIESNYSTPAKFWVVPAGASGEVRPLPGEVIDGATLGCGKHRVEIYKRGGKVRVGEITNLSYVDWGRKRDDISTSKIVVSGWNIDCGKLLAKLQTWAYELVIFRDNGYSVDRVWEGPITLLAYEVDSVTIEGKDVMGYAYRRIIKQAMNDTADGGVVTSRAAQVLRNVFAPDDPNVLAYLQVLARDDDAREYRSTPAYSRTAFEEVDDMAANAGLDYTAVGRAILLWGTKHRIGSLPEFRDEDLGSPPIVTEYGMSFANRYVVSDGNGVWGEATRLGTDGEDPIYGLVEILSSTWASDSAPESGTYTEAGLAKAIQSFQHFAEVSISDRYPPPVLVRIPDNTTLNPGTPISIQQLVPGVAVPLRSTGTLRSVVGTQKLDSVKVVEKANEETISITLSSFSRDDAALEATEE